MTTGMQIYDGSAAGIVMPDVVNLPASAVVGQVLTVGAGKVLTYEAGGGGGVAIGDPVTGGTNTAFLFVDGSGNVADNSGLIYSNGVYLEQSSAGGVVEMGAGNINAATGSAGRLLAYSDVASASLKAFPDVDDGLAELRLDSGDGDVALYIESATNTAWFDVNGGTTFKADGTTFEVVDVLKINNTVSAAVATASTHRVAINIGGTDYFILLTNIA